MLLALDLPDLFDLIVIRAHVLPNTATRAVARGGFAHGRFVQKTNNEVVEDLSGSGVEVVREVRRVC